MNKICTSIEQSQKLIELGIDVNTADIIYNVLDESYIRHDTSIDKYHRPAWSLSALIELMPFQIIEDNKRYGFKQYKGKTIEDFKKLINETKRVSMKEFYEHAIMDLENNTSLCIKII